MLVNSTGPLISGCAVELEGSVIVTRFTVVMCESANNGKRLMCESQYDFLVFIFVFTADDKIVDKNNNIHGE